MEEDIDKLIHWLQKRKGRNTMTTLALLYRKYMKLNYKYTKLCIAEKYV